MRNADTPPADSEVERLTDAVEELSQQVRVLWVAIDELRSEFTWAVQNDRLQREPIRPVAVKRMPLDPTLPREQWAAGVELKIAESHDANTAQDSAATTPPGKLF